MTGQEGMGTHCTQEGHSESLDYFFLDNFFYFYFFTVRKIEHWNRFPREDMDMHVSPSLEIACACMCIVLDSLLWLAQLGQGLDQMTSRGHFNPCPFCNCLTIAQT